MRFPGDGARGTRTPDLLGAIQAARRLNLAAWQAFSYACGYRRSRNSSAFCATSREFWHATASTWPQLDADLRGRSACLPPRRQAGVAAASSWIRKAHPGLERDRTHQAWCPNRFAPRLERRRRRRRCGDRFAEEARVLQLVAGCSLLVRCDRPVGIERDAPFQAKAGVATSAGCRCDRLRTGWTGGPRRT
jgi:hypothetical protein